MPTKTNRKPHARKGTKPRRAPNGRFKGQPRTLSETSMPPEYAPGTEVPREAAIDTRQTPTAATETDAPKRSVKAEFPSGYFYSVTYIGKPRPWYRRLWSTVLEWLR